MSEQRRFGALIIGDEILSGKRTDQHFSALARLLGTRGYRLSWVEYLGDERERIAANARAAGLSRSAFLLAVGQGYRVQGITDAEPRA